MKNYRITVVEDDADIAELLQVILSAEGYEVIVHHRFEDTAQLLQTGPDLVLLDEWLGTVPGHQICEALKKETNIPVLLLSAVSDIKAIAEACGADGFIAKPFDLEVLAGTVKGHLTAES